jgi:hypothetical protein
MSDMLTLDRELELMDILEAAGMSKRSLEAVLARLSGFAHTRLRELRQQDAEDLVSFVIVKGYERGVRFWQNN